MIDNKTPVSADRQRYTLRLFIAGLTPRPQRTIENLHRICAKYIPEQFELEIVDIYQQPEIAAADQVVAAPTLLKVAPLPLRRIIGDLSDEQRVMHGLGLSNRVSGDA